MTRETWTIYSPAGALVLTDGWVRDVETREGLYRTPPRRGANGAAGQQHGSEWTEKPYGEGSFQQQLWMMADATRDQVEEWYDQLLRVALWPYALIRVVRGLADGTFRECFAELQTALEPAPIGQLGMRVGLDWTIPEGFWRDQAPSASGAVINGIGSGAFVAYNALRGGTAPMPARVELHGPVSAGTKITQPDTGEWVRIDRALASDEVASLDSVSGTSLVHNETTMTDGPFHDFSYSGRMFLELPPIDPTADLRVQITYTGAAPGAAATLLLDGVRRWLA